MKIAFTIRWKVVGFAGGGAFLLSLLLGIMSGNPFLTILLRALLFGIVFALLGGGGALLIETFIPQLVGGAEKTAPVAPRQKINTPNVNIVLDGENDIEELSLDSSEAGEAPADESAGIAEGDFQNESFSETAGGELETLEDESESDDVADDPRLAAGATGSSRTASSSEPETAPARAARAPLAEETAAGPARESSGDGGDLDVLPDLSSFESSFSPVTNGGMVNDSESFETFGTDSLKRGDLDQDPETYVKAVRTIIRRDEGKNK